MSDFEYAMVLVSIVLGLGLTHILQGLGAAVHRLRGHGRPIQVDATYLFWVAVLFSWMVNFWWWEFKYASSPNIDLVTYLFLILYAISLFLLSVVLRGIEWGTRLPYVIYWCALTLACIVGLITPNRKAHLLISFTFLIWLTALTFFEEGVLGLR